MSKNISYKNLFLILNLILSFNSQVFSENNKLTPEESCVFKNNLSNNKNKLSKWIKNNPKKTAALITFLTLEAIGVGLFYSPLAEKSDKEAKFYSKLLAGWVVIPGLFLEKLQSFTQKYNGAQQCLAYNIVTHLKKPFDVYYSSLMN